MNIYKGLKKSLSLSTKVFSLCILLQLSQNIKELSDVLKMKAPLKTLSEIPYYNGKVSDIRLLTNKNAFDTIISCIDHAKYSIDITMYERHNDTIGKIIAEKLLVAADKGVKISIYKDHLGTMFGEGSHSFDDSKFYRLFKENNNISRV